MGAPWWHCRSCGLWFVYPKRLEDGTPVCPRCGSREIEQG